MGRKLSLLQHSPRDVSFVDTGEARILIVPDDKPFDEAPLKVRFAFNEIDSTFLASWEAVMGMVPIERAWPQAAWDGMPTYEQWLGGRRMPNLMPTWKQENSMKQFLACSSDESISRSFGYIVQAPTAGDGRSTYLRQVCAKEGVFRDSVQDRAMNMSFIERFSLDAYFGRR
jgi:hypothetical protein